MSDWSRVNRGRSKLEMKRSLTEWEDVDQPFPGCKTTLDSIHGFIRAEDYRMIGRVYRQSIRNLQGESVG